MVTATLSFTVGLANNNVVPARAGILTLLLIGDKSVENSGSIARDILATERTLQVAPCLPRSINQQTGSNWRQTMAERTQTSCSRKIIPACALQMANGAYIYLLIFATRRYLHVISALQKSKFPIDRCSVELLLLSFSRPRLPLLRLAWLRLWN